jgi:hypothetical protein
MASVYGTAGAVAHAHTIDSTTNSDNPPLPSRNQRSPGVGPEQPSRALVILESVPIEHRLRCEARARSGPLGCRERSSRQ